MRGEESRSHGSDVEEDTDRFFEYANNYFRSRAHLRSSAAFLSFVSQAPQPKSHLDKFVFEELLVAAFSSHLIGLLKETRDAIRTIQQEGMMSTVAEHALTVIEDELDYQEQSLLNISMYGGTDT